MLSCTAALSDYVKNKKRMYTASESKCIFTAITSRTRLFPFSALEWIQYILHKLSKYDWKNRKCAFVSVFSGTSQRALCTEQRRTGGAHNEQPPLRYKEKDGTVCVFAPIHLIFTPCSGRSVWSSALNAERSRGFKEKAASKWFSLSVLLLVLYHSLHWSMHIKMNW